MSVNSLFGGPVIISNEHGKMGRLQCPTAILAAALAGQGAIMVGRVAVYGQFGPGFKRAKGIKLCPFTDDPHKGIGFAGMIDESKASGFLCGVNGQCIGQFDNGDPLLLFCASPALAKRNPLTGKLPNFLPGS